VEHCRNNHSCESSFHGQSLRINHIFQAF
jgi:hypothetical protein